jgi:hypothetical protein
MAMILFPMAMNLLEVCQRAFPEFNALVRLLAEWAMILLDS